MGLFKKKKPVPEHFGSYYVDYDAIKSIKDIKTLLQSQWRTVDVTNDEQHEQFEELISRNILVKHI